MEETSFTTQALTSWLVARIAAVRHIEQRVIDANERFTTYGLDSIGAGRVISDLGEQLGRKLSPTLFWEYPTFASLARHLTEPESSGPLLGDAPLASEADEPIAVIGVSCRLPRAPNPGSFWQLLRDGADAISDVPAERGWHEMLAAEGIAPSEQRKLCRAGFLDHIDQFDPLFFGISPREAMWMDPQQRLMLELSWEALEDASVRPSTLRGSRTSVLVGAIWSDYGVRLHRAGMSSFEQYTVTGHHHSILANRISYLFGLEGPSFTIDSACSSGLVVVHLACDSLRRGESTLTIAGAVNLTILPDSALGVSRFGALSEDSQCYTFDARANGYVRGEGGVVVVLKRLSRAIADGDPIRCVIRGSAVNNDGASNGLTAPSRTAQEAVLRAAYRRAGVDPALVQYVEAHGTGTALGDPIEARALGAVLGARRAAEAPLLVGSAKTNVGHLEGAAGLVGLAKVALAIQHRQLPPSRNYAAPNPHAALAELHLAVPTELAPWPAPEQRLLAGVSSFGLGGTNGHVVLEEWPAPRPELLALCAATPNDLRARAADLSATLAADQERAPLATLCARSRAGAHEAMGVRLAVIARSHRELSRALDAFVRGDPKAALHVSDASVDVRRGVVFVCPGQGAQWFGMARSLLQSEPVIRATIERCDGHVRRLVGWSLLDELTATRAASRLDRIDVSLPVIISLDIAIAAWWRSLGVEPAAVLGHSTGEIAAAHIAGALDLADTMRVICAYGTTIGKLAGQGGMALVALGWDEVLPALSRYEGRVFRAIQNSVTTTVVAGEPAALSALLEELQGRGVFCRSVTMNVSPHCPRVDALRDELFDSIRGIRPRASAIPLYSEVTGQPIEGRALDEGHWVQNFGDPALFSRAIDAAISDGHRVFLEVGPHPITKHAIETNLRCAKVDGRVLSSLRRDEDERGALLDAVGALYAHGASIRWSEVEPAAAGTVSGEAAAKRPMLVPLSARSLEALASTVKEHAAFLRRGGGGARLQDIAYTASVRRDHHAHRLAYVASTHEAAGEILRAVERGASPAGVATGRVPVGGAPKVVFVFPGQGSQWVGMGLQLLADEPAFRAALEASDEAIRREAGFSVVEELQASERGSRLSRIDVVQPVLFAVEVALAALWEAWGVRPDAVVGHSMGEVAAAHVAGILTLEDAASVICRRSRLLRRASGAGAMALVELSLVEARTMLAGREGRLSVAVNNGPRSTVLSGEPAALEEVLLELERRGVFCRRVKVDVASHSPQMDPLRAELLTALRDLQPRAARVPMLSTVTEDLALGPELDAAYWAANLREPVLFSSAVQRLMHEGHGLFVEISPHAILVPALEENLREAKREGAAVGSTRRGSDELRDMLESLATLHVHGIEPDWRALFPLGGRVTPLPAYPWQRERHWLDDAGASATRPVRVAGAHPLLGQAFFPADRPDTRYWEACIGADAPAYLADHRVHGDVVLPGAGYVEVALAAAAAVLGGSDLVLHDVTFEHLLSIAPSGATRLQTSLVEDEDGSARITIASRAGEGVGWVRHACATARIGGKARDAQGERLHEVLARCSSQLEAADHLARMSERRIDYGPAFQGLTHVSVGHEEAVGRVVLPKHLGDYADHVTHPALLDACLQVSTTLLGAREEGTFVPVAMERVELHRRPPKEVWVEARLRPASVTGEDPTFDLAIVGEDGALYLEILGLVLRRLRGESATPFAGCAYSIAWRQRELSQSTDPSVPGRWVLFADAGGLAASVGQCLRRLGEDCVLVSPGSRFTEGSGGFSVEESNVEHYERLFRSVAAGDRPLRGIVHAWSLDASPWEATTADGLLADVRRGCLSALRLAQTIVRQGLRDAPRLVLVTRGTQAAGDSPVASVSQSPLWGLGRTIALELPDLACTRIDLAAQPIELEAERLVRELLTPDGEDQIALRDGGRFVARLERGDPPSDEIEDLAADGTYLIAGGLGGLGLSVATWMVSRGARHLVLVGRGEPRGDALGAVRAMRAAGADVRSKLGDISRRADVGRILAEIRSEMPALRGVVHAAAVLEDRTLQDMTEEQFWRPVNPKVLGAWNLHEATRDLRLDFFVLYSSAASLLGSPGQGNYAAANAFLETLARARTARGMAATAIQWGTFAEVGLAAAQANRGERLSYRGFEAFTPAEGTSLLARVLGGGCTEVGLMRWSVRQWIEFHPRSAASPFLSELRDGDVRNGAASSARPARRALERLPEGEVQAALEQQVIDCLSRVLRIPPDRIDVNAPFRDYGVDSLMSLEVRNRLEASLDLRLSATLLFAHPTVATLVQGLLAELRPAIEEAGESSVRASGEHPIALTEEAAAAMLDEKLLDLEAYLK